MTISLAKIKDNHIDTHTHTKSPLYQASVTSFRKKRGGEGQREKSVSRDRSRKKGMLLLLLLLRVQCEKWQQWRMMAAPAIVRG
ncbi:Uncharacterized protein APZ42_027982 [Daphnia magna]|uniref:Uncharacterized protein n=1 Tax=Daphnia magna TaxID=35525 RepID=A0A0P5W202_9CRUS|nr:Uncharacterized protein APZ42_027982 [Daphnia magna]